MLKKLALNEKELEYLKNYPILIMTNEQEELRVMSIIVKDGVYIDDKYFSFWGEVDGEECFISVIPESMENQTAFELILGKWLDYYIRRV